MRIKLSKKLHVVKKYVCSQGMKEYLRCEFNVNKFNKTKEKFNISI